MSPDVFAILPDVVWYLTQNGRDMWCRVPYGFFFSSAEAAAAFAPLMHSAYELQPTGVPAKELVSPEGLAVMRELNVTRIFLDPQIDPASALCACVPEPPTRQSIPSKHSIMSTCSRYPFSPQGGPPAPT